MAINSLAEADRGLAQGWTCHFSWRCNTAPSSRWISMLPSLDANSIPVAPAAPPAFTSGSGYLLEGNDNNAYCIGPWPQEGPTGVNRGFTLTHLGQVDIMEDESTAQLKMAMFFDRQWHCAGLAGNVTTLQSITTPGTIPAIRKGPNPLEAYPAIEIWTSCSTAPGGAYTATVTGTDHAGASRTWTFSMSNGTTFAPGRFFIPPQASGGAGGVSSITSFQLSAAHAAAGSIGLVVVSPVATVPFRLNLPNTATSRVLDNFATMNPAACLNMAVYGDTASNTDFAGSVRIARS